MSEAIIVALITAAGGVAVVVAKSVADRAHKAVPPVAPPASARRFVGLRLLDGTFVCADANHGGRLVPGRPHLKAWETFEWIEDEGRVHAQPKSAVRGRNGLPLAFRWRHRDNPHELRVSRSFRELGMSNTQQPSPVPGWYFKLGEATPVGPVPLSHLQSLVTSGHLRPTDWVWYTGWPTWLEARSVPELFGVQPPPAPVPNAQSRPNRTSTRQRDENHVVNAPRALVRAGYLCAVLSLFVLPPVFGLAGLVFGVACISKNDTSNGINIVLLSLLLMAGGMWWGYSEAKFQQEQQMRGIRR